MFIVWYIIYVVMMMVIYSKPGLGHPLNVINILILFDNVQYNSNGRPPVLKDHLLMVLWVSLPVKVLVYCHLFLLIRIPYFTE